MEQTVNIEKFWRIIKKRKFAIVISALLGLIMSMLLIAFVLVPKYESQAQLIVTLPKNETADIKDMPKDEAIRFVEEADQVCPYSKALRGNVTVNLEISDTDF